MHLGFVLANIFIGDYVRPEETSLHNVLASQSWKNKPTIWKTWSNQYQESHTSKNTAKEKEMILLEDEVLHLGRKKCVQRI